MTDPNDTLIIAVPLYHLAGFMGFKGQAKPCVGHQAYKTAHPHFLYILRPPTHAVLGPASFAC